MIRLPITHLDGLMCRPTIELELADGTRLTLMRDGKLAKSGA